MKSSRQLRRWLMALGLCFALVGLIGFFVLPPIVKTQAEKRLSSMLGRTVTIGKIRMNPYVLSMTVENFDIREKDGRRSFLGWNRVYVNVDLLSSLVGDWVISEVEVEGFHSAIVINPDRSFNFSDLLTRLAALTAPPPGAAPTKPMHPVRVVRMAVSEARAEFTDLTRQLPFKTVLGPLTFVLSNFRTAGSSGAPYHFQAVTESGEKLSWTGTLAAEPLASKGEFAIENLILKKYTPYFEAALRAALTDGRLTVRGRYEAALDGKKLTLKMAQGEVHLRDLKMSEHAGGASVVELPSLDVMGIQADAVGLRATIDTVAFARGHITVRRAADGSINLLTMLEPAPSPGGAKAKAAPMLVPDFKVGEVTLKDFKLTVTDHAAPRPAQLEVSDLQVSLKNATLADEAVMPLEASFRWAPQGTVHTAGTITLQPDMTADLKSEVSGFAILPLSPYLEQLVNARITQGALTTTNTVHLALPAEGAPIVTFVGDITVEKFGLVDALHDEELAGYASLTLKDLKASAAPQLTVSLAEINLTRPYARVVISAFDSKDGSTAIAHPEAINVMTVLKTRLAASAAATAPPAVPMAAAPPTAISAVATRSKGRPKVAVGRVVITDGDFSFTDRSVEPNVQLAIGQFGGTITGLSSANVAKAEVNLHGLVDGAGLMAVSGQLDPLGAVHSMDLKIDFKNLDLLPVSPYLGKYAGYELARGKLEVDTNVRVQNRKLAATNVVTLNQFTFGAATNSPAATGLPVRLGVALLKDTDGKIVIDLPVEGNLDDPNFRIGKVVMRVFVNLLTKAATSPFSLVGSMFGGGGDELAFQEFAPGADDLEAKELPKLDTLVKALTNRPALSLGLEGSYDAAADTYALQRQKLADQVRRQIWAAKRATNPNLAPPGQLVITAEENAAMVKKLFNEKFPPGTKFGTPLAAAPVVTAPPPPPAPGIVKRIINALTFQEARDEAAARKAEHVAVAEHEKAVAMAVESGLPLDEMTGRLAEAMAIDVNDLRALAAARAKRVRDQLINVGHLAPDRLFLAQTADATKQDKGPRVFLSLQ